MSHPLNIVKGVDADTLAACDFRALIDGLGQMHGLECATRRRMLAFVAEVDRRELWRSDGARSMAEWVSFRLDMSVPKAIEVVEVARAFENLPHIASAFERGGLSWDKVRLLVRFATPEEDAVLAREAAAMPLGSVQAMARQRKRLSEEAAAEDRKRRYLRLRWGYERRWATLEGRLLAEQAMILQKALDRALARLPNSSNDPFEGFRARSADALIEIAGGALAADPDADRATVVVNVDASLLTGGEGNASLENAAPIAPSVARRLVCDARIQLVSRDSDGNIVGIGEVSRTVSPWLRRQVRAREHWVPVPRMRRAEAR